MGSFCYGAKPGLLWGLAALPRRAAAVKPAEFYSIEGQKDQVGKEPGKWIGIAHAQKAQAADKGKHEMCIRDRNGAAS